MLEDAIKSLCCYAFYSYTAKIPLIGAGSLSHWKLYLLSNFCMVLTPCMTSLALGDGYKARFWLMQVGLEDHIYGYFASGTHSSNLASLMQTIDVSTRQAENFR